MRFNAMEKILIRWQGPQVINATTPMEIYEAT